MSLYDLLEFLGIYDFYYNHTWKEALSVGWVWFEQWRFSSCYRSQNGNDMEKKFTWRNELWSKSILYGFRVTCLFLLILFFVRAHPGGSTAAASSHQDALTPSAIFLSVYLCKDGSHMLGFLNRLAGDSCICFLRLDGSIEVFSSASDTQALTKGTNITQDTYRRSGREHLSPQYYY